MPAPMTRGSLKPAKITNLNTNAVVNFMFNPFEFAITKSNTWAPRVVQGINLPLLSFTNGGAQSVTLSNVQFDTTRDPGDVRAFTAPLWKMMMIDPDKADPVTGKSAPPTVAFEWGGLYFKAIITTLTETFTMFDANGVPLRSKVTLTLQQYLDEADLPPQLKEQVTNEKAREMRQEEVKKIEAERLDQIAAEKLGSSSSYRTVAENNNIDNPNRVPNGTSLRV